jgi:hypothetical protein
MDEPTDRSGRARRRARKATDPVTEAYQDEVRELARLVVSQVAPEELPMFAVVADACLTDPDRMVRGREDVRERLGFGVGEVAALITPFTVLAATEVVKYLTASALEVGRGAAGRIFRRKSKDARRKAAEEARRLELRDDQVLELRRIVLEKARQLDLPEAKAELLADAFVGSIAAGGKGG